MKRAPRLLYLVTEDWYFCSHRLALARAAREAGFDVTLATRVQRHGHLILEAGLDLVPLRLSRRSSNPVRELGSLYEILALYRRVRPDIVHHVALKPVLYGSIAAIAAGVPSVINALAGLGYIFSSRDLKARCLRPIVKTAFRVILNRPNSHVILQNPDDRKLLALLGITGAKDSPLIRGSGADLSRYAPHPEQPGVPVVVLPARMLRDKGVEEFIEAARILKGSGVASRFVLAGEPDPDNPASIPEARLKAWASEGVIEYWGWQEDMARVFCQAHVVCLPSYREGLPKVLIEAAASGRPIVTCDVPGCREIVRHEQNGLLVPARDPRALASALQRLIEDPTLRARFAEKGRAIAEAEFSQDRTIEQTLALYRRCQSHAHRCSAP